MTPRTWVIDGGDHALTTVRGHLVHTDFLAGMVMVREPGRGFGDSRCVYLDGPENHAALCAAHERAVDLIAAGAGIIP